MCFCVYMWVCCHGNSKLRASIFTKLGLYFVGKDSDHLQLIKFWPSGDPGKGVCGGAKMFGSALLQPAHSVCVSLGTFHYNRFDGISSCDGWTDRLPISIAYRTSVYADVRQKLLTNESGVEKALRRTLRAGCSKAEPKKFAPPQTPSRGARDRQNLIIWRWSQWRRSQVNSGG